jgi:hypothetical protein
MQCALLQASVVVITAVVVVGTTVVVVVVGNVTAATKTSPLAFVSPGW